MEPAGITTEAGISTEPFCVRSRKVSADSAAEAIEMLPFAVAPTRTPAAGKMETRTLRFWAVSAKPRSEVAFL